MSEPLVSVIIPAHNAGAWIAETLASACAQHYRALEILVVDDGSTDNTLAIAQAWPDPRIRVLQQAALGAPSARNHGWEQAQGELIQFLDADDLLSPDKIERQVARWRKHGDHYLYSAQWGRFWGDAQATQYQDQGLFQDHDPISWQVACWQNLTMMPPHVWLTPRRILERVNPWKEAILKNQDGEYFQRVIFASAGVLFCPEARCQYRSGNPNSVSAARSEASERDKFATFQLATTRLLALEDSPRTRLACASLWRGYAIQILPLHRSLAEAADALARSYGTVPMAPGKGRAFHALARLTGWRWARRLQALTGFRNR